VSDEPETSVIQGRAVMSASASVSARATTRNYFSTWMLRAAKRQAKEAGDLERSNDLWADPHALLILEAVVSTAVLTFTFVEALINEVFEDATDAGNHRYEYLEPLGEEEIAAMGAWWKEERNVKEPTLAKYKTALKLAGKRGVREFESWDDALALKEIRNEIVHFQPTWSNDEGRPKELEELLAHRYAPSTLSTRGAWWSVRALSAGCAEWCCASAEAVADEFSAEMGIVPNYLRVRNKS
jgi:hypothetical protein